jgi:hypothetical protein
MAVATSDISARRNWRTDHRFQHLRGDHNRFAGIAASARHLLLHAWHFFQWHFHAEITARDHQGIRKVHDFGKSIDRLRLLDLGHHGCPPARDLLRVGNILRRWMNERATQSMPVSSAASRSDRSLSARAENGIVVSAGSRPAVGELPPIATGS